MTKNSLFTIRFLASFLLITIVIQILLGAWVRLTGSGMSCPDWPLCYGFFFPSLEKINQLGVIEYSYFQIFLEWIHRANAAFIIGPLSIILFIYLVLLKNIKKKIKLHAYYLIILLGIQGLLGGLTVMKSNIPWSVAIHLASAFLLFYVVLRILLLSFDKVKNNIFIGHKTKKLIYLSLLLALITACAGAFTSKYGASLSCSKWPLCNQSLLPNFRDQFEVIHFTHRMLAFTLVLFLLLTLFRLSKYFNLFSIQIKVAYLIIPLIIIIQISIGALLIYFDIPIWMGIFHQFMGLLLFACISVLLFYINQKIQ